MARDWFRVAEDFQQKYVGTYCRYKSPITGKKEVFMVTSVHARSGPPDITLFHPLHGEIYIRYDGEVDLDFSFPDIGYFQHDDKAYRFNKLYMRQWQKGVCERTAHIEWPYENIYPVHKGRITHDALESAFQERTSVDLKTAVEKLSKKGFINVALNKSFSLGLGKEEGKNWLWFEDQPIATVTPEGVALATPVFRQELDDYMRDTGVYVRVIQAP